VHGINDYIEADTEAARREANKPIEGSRAAHAGMNWSATCSGLARCSCPSRQSARVMKQAVAYLQPFLEARRGVGAGFEAGAGKV